MLINNLIWNCVVSVAGKLGLKTVILGRLIKRFHCFLFSLQLLVGGGQTTTASSQSPISATNAPSLSPGGSATGAPSGALSPGAVSQTSNNAPPATSCCENGRPIMTDPVSGQTVCSCQYDSARLALSGYSRIPTGSVGVYGTPYPSTEQNPYPSIGVDSSAFYSPLVSTTHPFNDHNCIVFPRRISTLNIDLNFHYNSLAFLINGIAKCSQTALIPYSHALREPV